MLPAPFEYVRAESLEQAIQLVGEDEDAKILAGGHSLLPLMKLRLARPSKLVDIGRLSGLAVVRDGGDHLAVGALARYHDIANDSLVQEHCPLLGYTASQVGDPQVRHRGTIGGSLAHGDPASDIPTICLVLDAQIVATGPSGERVIGSGEMFKGFFDTALGQDELITEVRIPKVGAMGWSYLKFRQRALDWATVGVCAVTGAEDGTIAGARVGLTNMGQTPLRATGVEEALAGASRDAIGAAAERADEGTDPPSDTWATADFRRHLARVLTERALGEALSR